MRLYEDVENGWGGRVGKLAQASEGWMVAGFVTQLFLSGLNADIVCRRGCVLRPLLLKLERFEGLGETLAWCDYSRD